MKYKFQSRPRKQAQDAIFSRKSKKISHPLLFFNSIQVLQSSSQKHFCIVLDEQLTFCEHLKMLTSKVNKTIGPLQKLQRLLPRSALITIYKAFVRPHLDYGDIVYDEAYNVSFHHKLILIQYKACLAITGAIRDTSKEKLCQKLGLNSIQIWLWFRKLGFFYKIFKNYQPSSRSKYSSKRNSAFNTRNVAKIFLFKIKHNFFKKLFLTQLLLNGTIWILIYKMKIVFTFFKKIFCNL